MATTIGDVITPGQVKAFTVRETKPGALKDLAPQYKQLLTEPVTASLTTVNNKGEMQVTPVWVGNDGTYLELNSVRGRKKDRNLRSNGKVTLLLMNPKNPYHWMSINGKVVDIVDEDDKARGRACDPEYRLAGTPLRQPDPVSLPGSERRGAGTLQGGTDADPDLRQPLSRSTGLQVSLAGWAAQDPQPALLHGLRSSHTTTNDGANCCTAGGQPSPPPER